MTWHAWIGTFLAGAGFGAFTVTGLLAMLLRRDNHEVT